MGFATGFTVWSLNRISQENGWLVERGSEKIHVNE